MAKFIRLVVQLRPVLKKQPKLKWKLQPLIKMAQDAPLATFMPVKTVRSSLYTNLPRKSTENGCEVTVLLLLRSKDILD